MSKKKDLIERQVDALESIAASLLFLKQMATKVVQFDDEPEAEQESAKPDENKSGKLLANPQKKESTIQPAKQVKKRIGFNTD